MVYVERDQHLKNWCEAHSLSNAHRTAVFETEKGGLKKWNSFKGSKKANSWILEKPNKIFQCNILIHLNKIHRQISHQFDKTQF